MKIFRKNRKQKDDVRHWWQEDAEAKVALLKEKLDAAFASPHVKKNTPWILVIGEEGSGKTSLLANSTLPFMGIDGRPFTYTGPTSYCDWLISDSATFIDTSGSLMMPENPTNDAHFIWKRFLELLRQHRPRRPIVDGVMVCVDLRQQYQLDVFRHRIQALRQYTRELPIHIVFTKCDHIAGFMDSYSPLTVEEMSRMFGCSLPNVSTQQNISQVLETEFNLLLKNMHDTLLCNLHREHHLDKRALIKNFPLQIELQKRNIMLLANQLHSPNTVIKTICFTSAEQDGKTSDLLGQSHYFDSPLASEREDFHTPLQQKSFFIQKMMEKIIQDSAAMRASMHTKFIRHRPRLYLVLASVIAIFGFVMTYSYYQTAQTFDAIVLVSKKDSDSLVSTLSALKGASNILHQQHPLIANVIFKQHQQLNKDVQQTYEDVLASQFSHLVQGMFEETFRQANKLELKTLFDAMKAYSMLKDASHIEQPFLSNWFENYWRQLYPKEPNKQSVLMTALQDWMKIAPNNLNVDKKALSGAQKKLHNASLSALAYFHLHELYNTGETRTQVGKFFSITVPNKNSLYSPDRIEQIYRDEIPKIATKITHHGDWIMRLEIPTNLRQSVTEELIRDLRKLYAQNYAIYWQTQFFAATLNPFQHLDEAAQFSIAFGDPHSPIHELLNWVEAKLAPLQALPDGKEPLIVQRQIRTILTNALSNEQTKGAIDQLHRYLIGLNEQQDKELSILRASQQRMKSQKDDAMTHVLKQARTAPPPLQDWLNALATHTWSVMLKTSQRHLNLLWITQVLPVYNETVKDRYPIFSDAQNDMSLEAFSHFFGPNGVLDRFFKHEVAAFANTQKLYWTWQKVDGQQLGISQETLNMLNTASLIKQMFFSGQNTTPTFSFEVSPEVPLQPSVNPLLHLGSAVINHSQDLRRPTQLTWPFEKPDQAKLALQDHQETKTVLEEKGSWALFRLLSYANIQTSKNTRYLDVVFNANGMSVSYKLAADNPINPFIPNLLTSFRCPKDLT